MGNVVPKKENIFMVNICDEIPQKVTFFKFQISLGQVNIPYLRSQQNMLNALNATKILQTDQHKLRKVLRYQLSSLETRTDQSSNEEEPVQQTLVIQKLLQIATQPSPLKPSFSLEDMQLAALNLSQYLAAESNLDKPSPVNNNDRSMLKVCVLENSSELPTPNSECSVKSVLSEKNGKKKKIEDCPLPIHPVVAQIIEMGFTKKSVETAMKTIGKTLLVFYNLSNKYI